MPEFIKKWNEKFDSPKLVSSTIDQMMKDFVQNNKSEVPSFSGDLTPYWEDGVMSSAKEEGIAEGAVQRLIQNEALRTILKRDSDPKYNKMFYKAWRNAIMWHEHTWGAWSSISHPDSIFTKKQWDYKKNFALKLDSLSKVIQDMLIENSGVSVDGKYLVYNTLNWSRNGVIRLKQSQAGGRNVVFDEAGKKCLSQKLSNGDLLFWPGDIPAKSKKVFIIKDEKDPISSMKILHEINKNTFESEFFKIQIDLNTGSITKLIDRKNNNINLVDSTKGIGINEYLYVLGVNPNNPLKINGSAKIRIIENGPLFSSIEIISGSVPGAQSLRRYINFYYGADKVEIINNVDKTRNRERESVHFGFPVNLTNGNFRLYLGDGYIIKPNVNQLPGSNHNFNCVYQWLDYSNPEYGITVSLSGSPLIELGKIIDETKMQKNPDDIYAWDTTTNTSNTFYFYFMNNYWFTNYRSDQEGEATFRYSIYPHKEFDKHFSIKKGTEDNQPLLVSKML